jgi:hypothetical protein
MEVVPIYAPVSSAWESLSVQPCQQVHYESFW